MSGPFLLGHSTPVGVTLTFPWDSTKKRVEFLKPG